MKAEDEDELEKLLEEAKRNHVAGKHSRALHIYQHAISLAAPFAGRGAVAQLLTLAAGEYRDCDDYHHAADLLVAALVMIPADLMAVRAQTKRLLAITLYDIFGTRRPDVLTLLQESREDFIAIGEQKMEANVLQHIAGYNIQLGRLREADRQLEQASNMAGDDVQLQGWILGDMADLELERSQLGLALDLARRSRVKAREVGDVEGEADTWITESRISFALGFTDDALAAAQVALNLYIENENRARAIRAKEQVAMALSRLGKLEDAAQQLEEALTLATRLDLRPTQAKLHIALAKLAWARGGREEACKHAITAKGLASSDELADRVDAAGQFLRDYCL